MSVQPMLTAGDRQPGAPTIVRPLFKSTGYPAADATAPSILASDKGGDIRNRGIRVKGGVGNRAGDTNCLVPIVDRHENNAAFSLQLRESHWNRRDR